MEISAANLTALFTGFDVVFQRGFEKPPSYYEQITSVVRSASRQTTYPWLGRTTKFREWLGDRVIQALETHEYTIVNRNFEDTVAIDRNDIEDDTYGAYEPIIEQLGWDTKVHPDMLLFAMIKDAVANPGDVVGFDGVPFFLGESSGGPDGPNRDHCREYQLERIGCVLVPDRPVTSDSAIHLSAAARIRSDAND
jgi:phage major head subunit gpT-like protein